MAKIRDFLLVVVFSGTLLALVLTISRPILIPPGASNVTNLSWGWREFDYKDARYIQSPLGYMVVVHDSKASVKRIIDVVERLAE